MSWRLEAGICVAVIRMLVCALAMAWEFAFTFSFYFFSFLPLVSLYLERHLSYSSRLQFPCTAIS